MKEFLERLETVLLKFPKTQFECHDASPTLLATNVAVDDTYVLYQLLDTFYYGSAHWECLVSRTLPPFPGVSLQLHLNVPKNWSMDDIEREVNYKICLLKSAYDRLPKSKKGE